MVGKTRDPDERGPVRKEPRALRASDAPIGVWVSKGKPQLYLDELIQLDGRGEHQDDDSCIVCGISAGVYRCRECFTDDLYCKECIVGAHGDSPLHRIEVWTGEIFERKTLKQLGLRIQLGHGKLGKGRRGRCVLPRAAVADDFVVVDTYTIHEVAVDFCNCATAQPHDIQLLRARWYPSTRKNPRTAMTFAALRLFHIMALEAKCSGSEFYNSIARSTDNSGTEPAQDRYDEFLRMAREWRHLQMLKRAGRGHDPQGVEKTKDGECALLCPACPHPGKNLPENWKDAPKEKRFLYALFLVLDANFRMRRKKVSSEEKDPSLGDGWSFYGKIAPYYSYLAKHWGQKQERSTCVAHDAVDKPDRESRGTASSGIATVDCTRHNMKRPNGVGDLQLGERYINMDYIFFMSLAGNELSELYVSYDIACQWHKNIWERMKTFDKGIRFRKGRKYCVFLIPKFHLPAHIEACNILFSFHLTRYVGMTDGEAPERGWSNLNPLATSTAEMGPGMRRDTINDAFNDWNHKKIIGFGELLQMIASYCRADNAAGGWALKKIRECVPEMITTMDEEVEAWEEDATNPNPFASRVKHKTVLDVRREMAEKVQQEIDDDLLEGLTVSEEMHATEMQQTTMTERTNKLRRKLLTWMDAQVTFIPAPQTRISATQAQPGLQVQHMALWLPSDIKGRVECDVELYEYELRLQEAQAHEALDGVRDGLLLRTHLYKHKDMYVRGVKANTRCQTKINNVDERIRRTADRYRAARRALVGLGKKLKKTAWEVALRPLLPADVRGMPRALAADARAAVVKATMSWIWRSPGVTEGETGAGGMNEALRIEWAKTRVQAMRQAEQVDLVEEEMRRVLAFFQWRAGWWEEMAGKLYAPRHKAYEEGNTAYAKRQAARLRRLGALFEKDWEDVPDFIGMGRTALGVLPEEDDFPAPPPVPTGDDTQETPAPDEQEVPPRPPPPAAPAVPGAWVLGTRQSTRWASRRRMTWCPRLSHRPHTCRTRGW
ncbi:hypothetical protein DFH09DRAFT_1408462 [Mycena vulgaris]|nr:hypothetical protein DFH09DRAFT_1408462 [Mycena vulgaris]